MRRVHQRQAARGAVGALVRGALTQKVRGQSGTIIALVNALAKAGIDLGENGSIIPRPKAKCVSPTNVCRSYRSRSEPPGLILFAREIYRKLPRRLPKNEKRAKMLSMLLIWLVKNGGRYWTRTSDPCDVNTVLYQLS